MIPIDDDQIAITREMHRQGSDAQAGAAIVLGHMRDTIANAIPDLARHERELRELGAETAADCTAGVLACLRAVSEDCIMRRAAILVFARDFRALDPELTPVRSPSQQAIEAFRSSQAFSERAGAALKGSD